MWYSPFSFCCLYKIDKIGEALESHVYFDSLSLFVSNRVPCFDLYLFSGIYGKKHVYIVNVNFTCNRIGLSIQN